MQRKLKSLFRRSIGKAPEPSKRAHESNGHTNSSLPRVNDHPNSAHNRGHSASAGINGEPHPRDRVRPVSSTYGSPAAQPSTVDNASDTAQSNRDHHAHTSMPSDRKTVPGGQNSTHNGGSNRNHEEVANGNIVHPSAPVDPSNKGSLNPEQTRLQQSATEPVSRHAHTDDDSFASAMSSVSTSAYGEHQTLNNGSKQSGRPREFVRSDAGLNEKPSKITNGEHNASGFLQEKNGFEGGPVQFHSATKDRQQNAEETELHKQLRLDGVVDLSDTVDTDGDIKWAPAITHETIKPHQHEIVQAKVYREIHNYEYFHRIQPVMMTEVLPPRHWIPNPGGEGLIEISADELPARTGENRWWSVIQHESPYSAQKTRIKWRTEPEIIERGTTITENGFERKETIIIHPPTLTSLTGYNGPVQPVHFDHKTGERWLGEMSTMDELQDLQKLLDSAPEAHAFQLNELNESLPRTSSNAMPKRKLVPGETKA